MWKAEDGEIERKQAEGQDKIENTNYVEFKYPRLYFTVYS
jgi:hypothetical protein